MTQSADERRGREPSRGPEAIAAPGAGRNLLLVDDDAPLRRSMARALERRGFQVLAAEGLAEARDHAHAHRPEFAVLDMRLTEGSGLDLVRTLRELRPGDPDRDRHRLWQHRDRGRGDQGRRGRLSRQAGRCRRRGQRAAQAAARACRRRATIRCRPTGCAGSTSSGCSSSATATSPRPRAGSTCTGARCSGS